MDQLSAVASARPLTAAVAATAVAVAAYYALRPAPSNRIPTLNVWSLFVSTSSHSFTRRLLDTIKRYPSDIFRLSFSPFVNVIVLKGTQGTKFFHGSRDLDLDLGFQWLLGDLQPRDGKGDLDIIGLFLPNLKPKAVEVRVAQCMVPTMGAWIKKVEAGQAEGEITDLIPAFYDVIVSMALRSFVGYTNGDNEPRIQKLIQLMAAADPENMIRKNPVHLVAPNWPSAKRERDAAFGAIQDVMREMVDDYWQRNETGVPTMEEDPEKEYVDHDLMESATRAATRRVNGKLEVNYAGVFNLIYRQVATLLHIISDIPHLHVLINALFAAASNQFVVSALYLYFLSSNPTDKAAVLQEIQPLVAFLRQHSFSTASTSPDAPHLDLSSIPSSLFDGFQRLESGVLETIRMTARGFAPRIPTKDVEFGGHIIKKGTPVLLSHETVHGDETFYEDVKDFKGGRFVKESGGCMNPHSNDGRYIGFGYGRHPCLGMRFATAQIKVIVATILSTWDIEFPEPLGELPFMLVGILRPGKPLTMKWKRRADAL
ncbi:hypothetical protein HK097_008436 [Rhizophlyctis rosea]|uniref:Cytochrome P450 n=1 Tax=Rhizophlyctis rosea TaxID=64517 RepID=A0AAD5SN94_9FUNG|nr:hypothetical protein HK097_008436 [Rhizophlyctis rosea]